MSEFRLSTTDWVVSRAGVVPSDYGVPTDGTTDATEAYQTMLDSLPAGSTVGAAPGDKFKISSALTLAKAVTIRGGEYLANPTGPTFTIAADDVSIDDLTITGPGSTPVQESGLEGRYGFIFSQGTSASPIARTRISRVKMSASPSSLIWLVWHEDLIVERCHLSDYQYAGVMLLSPRRAIVDGNTIIGAIMDSPLVNAYGIAASDVENTVDGRAEDVRIINNYISGVLEWEGIDTHGGKNIQIMGNTVKSCLYGIALAVGNALRVVTPTLCTVVGNYLERGGAVHDGSIAIINYATSSTVASNTSTGFAS